MQIEFDKGDLRFSKMSGLSGEATEAEELLLAMGETQDDLLKCKDAKKKRQETEKTESSPPVAEC